MRDTTTTKSPGKGGRPKLSPDERLSEVVHCRMTTAELEHARTQANLSGLGSVSEFMRYRSNSYRIIPPANGGNDAELIVAINELARQVKAIGVNYNQLLVAVHRGRKVNEPLDAIHEQIEDVLGAAKAALKRVTGSQ